MLRVIAGAATPVMRRLLLESFLEAGGKDGTVFLVIDEDYASACQQSWARRSTGLACEGIVALPELLARIRPAATGLVLGTAERLALLRNLLLAHPNRYDRLVGERSAPHLTYGVLVRIAEATAKVRERDRAAAEGGEETQSEDTPRTRQLRDLGTAYEARLEAAGAIDETIAERQAWTSMRAKDLAAALPPHQRIVVEGFDSFSDTTFIALRRLRDLSKEVLLLLDYDPEKHADRYSHLNAAYERLYDLAGDRGVVLDPPGQDDLFAQAEDPAPTPVVVDVPTRTLEVQAIAQYLRAEIDQHREASFPYYDYAVCFPALDTYAPLVEQTFADYGLPCRIERGQPVLQQPLAKLFELIKNAIASGRSFVAIRELLKSRFLPPLLAEHGGSTTLESFEQVQWLDRFRREEGISSAGRQLLLDLRRAIDNNMRQLAAHEERRAGSEDEHPRIPMLRTLIANYRALEQTLEAVHSLLDWVSTPRSLELWREDLRKLLELCSDYVVAADTTCARDATLHVPVRLYQMMTATHDAIATAVDRLAESVSLFGHEPVDFPRVFSVLRVLLRGETVAAESEGDPGFLICRPSGIRGRSFRVVLGGGMVDTDFPQYLTREARLEDSPFPLDQKQNIARQRQQFDRLLAAGTERILLFVPRSDSDAELLESQFVEELQVENPTVQRITHEQFTSSFERVTLSCTELLARISECLSGRGNASEAEWAAMLRDRHMSAAEQRVLENIVYNLCANDERHRADALGNFDGFIYEPALLKYLQRRVDAHVHSVSQLDILVQCPFRYFVEQVLEVREMQEHEEGTAPRRMGELAHDILYSFYTEWVERGNRGIAEASRADAGVILSAHAENALARASLTAFERDSLSFRLYGSAGINGLRGEVPDLENPLHGVRGYRGLLPAFLDLEVERAELAGESLLQPQYFELGFGLPSIHKDKRDEFSSKTPVTLQLPDGETIRLRGRSDRVDVGEGEFAIVDYKTGSSPSITEQKQGFRVQLPVYLMAVEQVLREQDRILQPAGGMFVSLTPKEASVEGQFIRKSHRTAAGISTRKSGMADEEFEDVLLLVRSRIADGLSRIREGRFHVTLAGEKIACAMCGNVRVCRKDLARAERLVPQVCGP